VLFRSRKRKHQSRSDEPKNNQYRSKNKHSKSITKSNMPKMKSSISLSFLQFCLASILLSGGYAQNSQCVTPTGIGDSNGVTYSGYNLPGAPFGIFGTTIQTMLAVKPGFGVYETPILFRLLLASVSSVYGTAAAFHPQALEMFGRTSVSTARRRCQPSNIFSQSLYNQHRALTLAYATLWGFGAFVPTVQSALTGLAATWNVDLNICATRSCADITTPWGLARSIVDDAIDIFAKDGWNADGKLSGKYNLVPYEDWRPIPYAPRSCSNLKCWEPLTEHAYGYLIKQQHVVPHIGATAKSFFLGDADICSRILPSPTFNYVTASQLSLARMANLTDATKAEVEYFDPKLTSLGLLEVQYFQRRNISLDSFEFIQLDAAIFGAAYESVIVAWKEKVFHDRARPTTYVNKKFGSQKVFSYLGNKEMIAGWIPAKDWKGYVRVMPHSDFPSGSACVCTAFAKGMIELTGSDSVLTALGGPLSVTINRGASIYEKGKPAADVSFTWDTWSQVADRCGISRLNGGLHYDASVTGGAQLCSTIGTKVGVYFKALQAGQVPAFVADVKNSTVKSIRCTPRTWGQDDDR